MAQRLIGSLSFALLLGSCSEPSANAPPPAASDVGDARDRGPVVEETEIDEPEVPEIEEVVVTDSEPASVDSAFDSNAWNSAVGVGGAAGGRYGGRGGRPAARSRESYASTAVGGFLLPDASPLSTFAADVDTASFCNVRRILGEGRLPPANAVRVEEFVNACRYDAALPAPRQTFGVDGEIATCPWNPEHDLVRFSLQTRPIEAARLPPCNFVFLVDVSGSMSAAKKLPLVQRASDLLVDQLRPQDRISIVTYARGVAVVLDSAAGDQHGPIRAAFHALRAHGSTNGQGGIQAAYDLAIKNRVQGVNRVLLATDGDFNVGIQEPDALESFIAARKDEGVFLTVLGFGTGNLKEDRLERLANRGNGAYHYIDGLQTARRVLVEEFGAEMMTVAKDVKLQAEWNQDLVQRYRLLGYDNRRLAATDFRDDAVDGGEVGAGHAVTALYEIERRRDAVVTEAPLVTLRIRYKPPEGANASEVAHEFAAPSGGSPQLSASGRTAALAAALAMVLREDEHRGAISARLLREMIEGVDAQQNGELVELARSACELLDAQASAPNQKAPEEKAVDAQAGG